MLAPMRRFGSASIIQPGVANEFAIPFSIFRRLCPFVAISFPEGKHGMRRNKESIISDFKEEWPRMIAKGSKWKWSSQSEFGR
jgi:hypothetical protein